MPDRASSINYGLDGLTSRRARQILLASIKEDPAGDLYIEDTPAMKNYRLLNPEFRFAVFYPVTGALFQGRQANSLTISRSRLRNFISSVRCFIF